MIPKLPYRTTEELREEADRILREFHPSGDIPIPIDYILEAGFGLLEVPVRGFRDRTGSEGGLSGDLSSIIVDEWMMLNRPTRYRFTLAHELSHYLLHRPQIEALDPEEIAGWKTSLQAIDARTYRSMEWQAYELAGLLLVPRTQLLREFETTARIARDRGVNMDALTEYALGAITGSIGDVFLVSGEVIKRRLAREDVIT